MPFAQPPVGELRFRAPLPPAPWTGIRNSEVDGPQCIQTNFLFYENPPVEGDEDCLYINVYTPNLQNDGSLLPVMVNIHYGGFFAGTGNSDFQGPEFFMDKDVILVTFNYRLGVFGFLSTLDDASPGNWALKDQVAALQWVYDNIKNFGGDNKRVTIFGQSSGGGSVHLHYFSPLTKGLFQRGIAQSGSAFTLWSRPNNQLQLSFTKAQASFVNCNFDEDTYSLVNCLRNVDAVTLVNSSSLFKLFFTEPITTYGPVIEKKSILNPKPYIIEDPLILLQNGQAHNLPLIMGVVQNEGAVRSATLLSKKHIRTQLNANFSKIAPKILGIGLSTSQEEINYVWSRIEDYLVGQNFVDVTNQKSVQGFTDIYSDRFFVYGSYQSALLHAWKGNSTLWFYHFSYRGEYTFLPYFAATTETIDFDWGICHCDELIYLFRSTKLFGPLLSQTDKSMRKLMIQMWTNFATYDNPTPSNDEYSNLWTPVPNLQGLPSVQNKHLVYLNISGDHVGENPIQIKMENKLYKERMLFWESLPLSENIVGIE
ncbi:hypothetical protein FQA39_LY05152 [Lamprigera yunnana]|nr:hypothetical protein FQA39_LY05152 [Lamprigera yunnana]